MAGYGMPDDEAAAFGVYPQLARRRESSNDREGAREVPVQAARGMLAGTLGIPGDVEGLARTGARYLGANVREAPVMPTSDELRERLPVPATSPAGRVAGAVGAAVGLPAGGFGLKAAKEAAPAVRRIAAEVVENAHAPQPLNRASQGQMGAIVFHGSPHTFDKFDAAKIGTGEGNQTFGRGLYMAESPEVADAYRVNLTSFRGGPAKFDPYGSPMHGYRRDTVADFMQGQLDHIESLQQQLAQNPNAPHLAVYLRIAQEKLAKMGDVGAFYKADLADDAIPRMLDWDKPIQAQSRGVKERLDAVGIDPSKHHGTGGGLINELGGIPGRIPDMPWIGQGEQFLQRGGIPGVQYLDEFSRVAKRGTSNFVVFPGEEGLLKILERNGRPIE